MHELCLKARSADRAGRRQSGPGGGSITALTVTSISLTRVAG